jgi:hypothetical protein
LVETGEIEGRGEGRRKDVQERGGRERQGGTGREERRVVMGGIGHTTSNILSGNLNPAKDTELRGSPFGFRHDCLNVIEYSDTEDGKSQM